MPLQASRSQQNCSVIMSDETSMLSMSSIIFLFCFLMIISICCEMPPTDCTLLAVYSPTEFAEYTEPFCCIFSHRFHRFSQMLPSRGCTCLKCTNLLCCCTSCFVVAHLASLVPFFALLVHLRQVHPLKEPICVDLLSMLKSKCFDHYFHFKLRFYIQG